MKGRGTRVVVGEDEGVEDDLGLYAEHAEGFLGVTPDHAVHVWVDADVVDEGLEANVLALTVVVPDDAGGIATGLLVKGLDEVAQRRPIHEAQ